MAKHVPESVSALGVCNFSPRQLTELQDYTITSIAARHAVTPGQVLLRWGLQQGVALLPKSCRAERQKENLKVWDFSLSAEDLALIDKLDKGEESQNTMAGWLREHDPDFY